MSYAFVYKSIYGGIGLLATATPVVTNIFLRNSHAHTHTDIRRAFAYKTIMCFIHKTSFNSFFWVVNPGTVFCVPNTHQTHRHRHRPVEYHALHVWNGKKTFLLALMVVLIYDSPKRVHCMLVIHTNNNKKNVAMVCVVCWACVSLVFLSTNIGIAASQKEKILRKYRKKKDTHKMEAQRKKRSLTSYMLL